MATPPRARRRGYATEVLSSLLGLAAAHGAAHAHLSVTEDNAAARALYGRMGFAPQQRYSYFTA